ncbi:MAG: hypothetical protein NWS62_02440 [Gaiellales bacterium]|nr:hypothetical protein [Gaiellales bacterium]
MRGVQPRCTGDRGDHADVLAVQQQRRAWLHVGVEGEAARAAVGVAATMQARDGLLAEEAPLFEGDGRLDESDLGRHPALVDVMAEAHLAGLDAQRLGGGVGDRYRAGCHRGSEHVSQLGRWHECINAR